jgi:hypothetical protein
MSKSVFISHSHLDHAAADAVRAVLEDAGVECWISSRDIPHGVEWADAIMAGLDECRFVVLVLSKRSQKSRDVLRELNLASNRGMPIITFRIDNTPAQGSFEYYTTAQQWVTAHNPVKREDLEALLAAVRLQLAKKEQVWVYGRDKVKWPYKRRLWIAAAIAAVAITAQALIQDSLFRAKPPAGAVADSTADTSGVAIDRNATIGGAGPEPTARGAREEPLEDGVVSFLSNPPGAAVTVNGEPYGTTPRRNVAMQPGSYAVAFALDGYQTRSRQIVVNPGASQPVEVDMAALSATLTVHSVPESARVQIGRLVDVTPCSFDGLPGGRHIVQITRDGYAPRTDTLTIVAGQDQTHRVRLSNQRGWLEARVLPKGMIYLDGERKTGDTGKPFTAELAPGTYRVEARHVTHGAWPKTVTIRDGADVSLVFDFTQQFDVMVTSVPDNAKIFIDDQDTGEVTPFTLKLRPGSRKIQVLRDGYLGQDPVTLLIEGGDVAPVHFTLRRAQ